MQSMNNYRDLLKVYYSRLFPYDEYYKWLSYGNMNTFRHREFSFTLEGDVYIRYKAFKDQQHMARELLKLVPMKIDIGAIFNVFPGMKSQKLVPLERELVFDIDLTDYDEVRTCCSGADICNKCWKYMAIACKILDIGLRDDFGFKHILWVFSGRRGIHAWVCDPIARALDSTQRMAIADFFQIIIGGAYVKRKVNLYKIHPSVRRAIDIISPIFVSTFVEEQDILGNEQLIDKFTGLLPDTDSVKEVKTLFEKYKNSVERWEAFVDYANNQIQSNKKWRNHRNLVEEIMLQYCYPRLDINVTKGLNHLLKSPFCVHPKTGKISVPFNPKAVDKFDPAKVPTIEMVIKEIDEFHSKEEAFAGDVSSTFKIKDYKKTSLNKSMHVFGEFLRGLENAASDKTNEEINNTLMDIY